MSYYSCDFETSTIYDGEKPKETWVYVWGVYSEKGFSYGRDIDSFFDWLFGLPNGSKCYFHNEKFDGSFILNSLLQKEKVYVKIEKDEMMLNEKIQGFTNLLTQREFNNLKNGKLVDVKINNMGIWYSIKITVRENKKNKTITVYDSFKLLSMGVKEIAEKFLGLPKEEGKLDYDYDIIRYPDTPLTEEEIEYLKHDVKIVYDGLNVLKKEYGVEANTAASAALQDFKLGLHEKYYEKICKIKEIKNNPNETYRYFFPTLSYEENEIASISYKGGLCYVSKEKAGNTYGDGDTNIGFTIDANSLYPSVMIDEKNIFPVGEGKYFTGKGEVSEEYPLFIQVFSCVFKLKKNCLPIVNFKSKDKKFNLTAKHLKINELLTNSNGVHLMLCMTSIDLEVFLRNYNVMDLEYHYGYKYRGVSGIFSDYIQKWQKVKIQAVKEGNMTKKGVSKIFQNSLYGKFGSKYEQVSWKIPYIQDGVLKFLETAKRDEEAQYMPMASFITSYARRELVRLHDIVVEIGRKFFMHYTKEDYYVFSYCDTDSLHCLLPWLFNKDMTIKSEYMDFYNENKDIIDKLKYYIDDAEYGKWKKEESLYKVRYIRAKTYLEQVVDNGKIDETLKKGKSIFASACAGLPKDVQAKLTFDNFYEGMVYDDVKLMPVQVKGGQALVKSSFEIKGGKRV